MTKRSTDEFRPDLEIRQRNLVYPDTLRNEARGWRGLMTSKEPLSVVQVVGLSIMLLGLPLVMVKLALTQFHDTPGTGARRLVAGLGGYVIYLVICGALFPLLRWRVRKALGDAQKRPRAASRLPITLKMPRTGERKAQACENAWVQHYKSLGRNRACQFTGSSLRETP